MLCLTSYSGESVTIGESTIHIIRSTKGHVKLAIDAPPSVAITRSNARRKSPRSDKPSVASSPSQRAAS